MNGTYVRCRHGELPPHLQPLLDALRLAHKAAKVCKCGRRTKRVGTICAFCTWRTASSRCAKCGGACHRTSTICQPCSRKKQTRVCRGCLRDFVKNSGGKGIYCSRACAFANILGWSRRPRPKTSRAKPPRPCIICGTERPRRRIAYCSDQCRDTRQPKPVRSFKCMGCGLERRGLARQLYCSKKCHRRLRKYSHLWSGLRGTARAEMIATALALKSFNCAYNETFLQKGTTDGEGQSG
jgi:hypothetical protein